MNLVQFKRHDGDVFINPTHVAMVEPSAVGDGNGSSPPGPRSPSFASMSPSKDVVDKLRRETHARRRNPWDYQTHARPRRPYATCWSSNWNWPASRGPIPIITSPPEKTWIWSDHHLGRPERPVLLSIGRSATSTG